MAKFNIQQSLSINLAKTLRPHMATMSWIIYSCVIIVNSGINIIPISLGLFLFISLYGIATIQNDLADYESDKINKRDIPYAKDEISKETLVDLKLGLIIFTVIVSLLINPLVLIWTILYIFLGWLYSGPANIKSRGVFAAILLGVCYRGIPWLMGASALGLVINLQLIIIALASFIFASGIIVLKDFKDLKGDRETGKRTLLVAKGKLFTRKYFILVTSVAYIILIAMSYWFYDYWLLALGILLLITNYILLQNKLILSSTKARLLANSRARMLFLVYSILMYIIIH